MNCLITGSTGFLGKYIVRNLSKKYDEVLVLVRSNSLEKAKKQFADYNNIVIVEGDIENPDIFEDYNLKLEMIEKVNIIIHAAALYELDSSFSRCNQVNIIGTQNILFFANQCKKLRLFHYISTIAVAGDFVGTFYENELNVGQKFSNHYSHSKFVAEKLVQDNVKGSSYKTRVFRLGVLVGDSKSGYFEKIDGPYYFLELLRKVKFKKDLLKYLRFLFAPFDRDSLFPMIPIDIAAEIVCDVNSSLKNESDFNVYHVVGKEPIKIVEIIEEMFHYFNVEAKIFEFKDFGFNKFIYKILGIPTQINEYMYAQIKYDIGNVNSDYRHIDNPSFSSYKDIMFTYFFDEKEKGSR